MKKQKCSVCKKKKTTSRICRARNGKKICVQCCNKIKDETCRSCPHFEILDAPVRGDQEKIAGSPDEIMSMAMEHQREGRLSEAARLYEHLLKDNPKDASVSNFLGTVRLQTGDFSSAVKNFENAVENDPSEDFYRQNLAAAYNSLGGTLLSKKDEKGAMEAFEKAVSANPEYVEAYNNLGCLQKSAGRVAEAVESFQKAVSIAPDSEKVLNNLGNALDAAARIDEAIDAYRKAVAIAPGYARAHFNLAVTLASVGRIDEAEESYERCIKANPKFHEAYNNLGNICKEREDYDSAVAHYRRAVEARPEYAEAHCNLGIALHALENYEQAAEAFLKAVEIHPDYDEAHYCLGLAMQKLGDTEDALFAYQRAVEINPHHYKAWYSLGNVYVSVEAHQEAAEAYEHVIDLHGRFGAVYYNLAHAYRNIGEKQKAMEYFQLELDHDPDDYSSRYMLSALAGDGPASAPKRFVRDVFDEYAEIFDSHLVEELEYRTPSILKRSMEKLRGANCVFENVLDLGCGTGLSGQEFRKMAKRMEGADISPLMIEKAREKNIYDRLETGDFFEIYRDAEDMYDLMIAADVFVYMGDLGPAMSLAARICAPGGYFVFSLEHFAGDGFLLDDTGRFSHAPDYVKEIAAESGFALELLERANLRKERGEWVEGDVYVLRKGPV